MEKNSCKDFYKNEINRIGLLLEALECQKQIRNDENSMKDELVKISAKRYYELLKSEDILKNKQQDNDDLLDEVFSKVIIKL